MLLELGVGAVMGDGVEVEVERAAAAEVDAEAVHGVVPGIHQRRRPAGVDAAGVLGEGGALRHGVEASEQGEPRVEGLGHDVHGPADAPQLEGEQRADGAAGGDHGAARQAVRGEEAVEVEAGEVGGEQEQAAEVGAQAPWREIERAPVGDRRRLGAGGAALLGGAPPELREPGPAQDPGDGGGADRQALVGGQARGDLGRRELLVAAQRDDARIAVRPGPGLPPAAAVGQEEGAVGLLAEGGAEVAEGADGIAEAPGGLCQCQLIDIVGAERLVLALGAVGGRQEPAGESVHLFLPVCLLSPLYVVSRGGATPSGAGGAALAVVAA